MKLSQLLNLIQEIAQTQGITAPYICGGVPRDRVLNRVNDLADVDLTTGDATVHSLAKEVSVQLGQQQAKYLVLPDGHAQLTLGDFKLDFSSNFIVPNLSKIITQPLTSLQQEVISRDFTCNTLLMSLDLKHIIDPMGIAIPDLRAKKLRTCLAPEITLAIDPKRVVRILYLAAKLDFQVDSAILRWVSAHPQSIAQVKSQYLSKKLQQALDYNETKTIQLLDQMGLFPYVPPLPALQSYLAHNPRRYS